MASSSSRRLSCLHWKPAVECSHLHCYRSWTFWRTCCSFPTSPRCFTLCFLLWSWLLSFDLMNQPLPLQTFLPQPPHLSQPSQNYRELARALLWIRLRLKGMLGLVCSSLQRRSNSSQNFSLSAIKLFPPSYDSCAHWRSTFNVLQACFPCTHNLADVWHKRPSFQPISVSTCLPH